jgi:hypothetical protein
MSEANSWGIYFGSLLLLLLLLGVADIKSMIKVHVKKLEEAEAEKIALLTNIDRNYKNIVKRKGRLERLT